MSKVFISFWKLKHPCCQIQAFYAICDLGEHLNGHAICTKAVRGEDTKSKRKGEIASVKMTRWVDKMSEVLHAFSEAKSDAASVMLQLKTLRMSPPKSTMNVELQNLKEKVCVA